jgi:hypothetical protein
MRTMDFAPSSSLYLCNDQEADMGKATTLDSTTQPSRADMAETPAGSTSEAMPHVHELDHRHSQRIDVSLLWNAHTDQVSIALTDERSGEALTFMVDPSEALSAFHHPYAYAAH